MLCFSKLVMMNFLKNNMWSCSKTLCEQEYKSVGQILVIRVMIIEETFPLQNSDGLCDGGFLHQVAQLDVGLLLE